MRARLLIQILPVVALAIEVAGAARAGEQGRGFAVVAEEVRKNRRAADAA